MKRKKIEKVPPVVPKHAKQAWAVASSQVDGILILDIWNQAIFRGRYCMNLATGEYAVWHAETGTWTEEKLCGILGLSSYWPDWGKARQRLKFNRKAEEQEVFRTVEKCYLDLSGYHSSYQKEVYDLIEDTELFYSRERRERKEQKRTQKVQDVMAMVPDLPEDFEDWLFKVSGAEQMLFRRKDDGLWHCTACGQDAAGVSAGHNKQTVCPVCGAAVTAKTKTKGEINKEFKAMLLQPVNELMSVARHFDVRIRYMNEGRAEVLTDEGIRIIMFKRGHGQELIKLIGKRICDKKCEYYTNQYTRSFRGNVAFDYKANPANRRTGSCYIYPQGVSCLAGTAYSYTMRIMQRMATEGAFADYNRLMCAGRDNIPMLEYMFKGRFYRLMRESLEQINYNGTYYGILRPTGRNIEEVFKIRDRQKINLVRDLDGGWRMVSWLRWSEKSGERIPAEGLRELENAKLSPGDFDKIIYKTRLSVVKILNYLKRQQAESYPSRKLWGVLDQWKDYLDMAGNLGKDMADPMVYKPRELKRRHDELVSEMNKRKMLDEIQNNTERWVEESRKMSEKFSEAELVMQEVADKLEYASGEYVIRAPRKIMDVVVDGNALHHCAGASERYFDRIRNHETYICFCRKAEAPEVPYYTIEVEPGGTIRQHRGYLDEEPEIERVKPFLREWQKELRRRMTEKDHDLARESRRLREANIMELKEKNNTRVLQGLMEDFMEAVG